MKNMEILTWMFSGILFSTIVFIVLIGAGNFIIDHNNEFMKVSVMVLLIATFTTIGYVASHS